MNNELRQKLDTIISPRLLLEKLPTTPYGVAFVAWGVYNSIGQEVNEEEIRKIAEEFIREHRFCIRILDQLIASAEVGDFITYNVYATEFKKHPGCLNILDKMFPKL